jgi:hypothetical protein
MAAAAGNGQKAGQRRPGRQNQVGYGGAGTCRGCGAQVCGRRLPKRSLSMPAYKSIGLENRSIDGQRYGSVFMEGAARERGLFFSSGSSKTFGAAQYPTSLGQDFASQFRPFGRLMSENCCWSKIQGTIGEEDHAVTVLRRLDLVPESRRDLLHYAPGRLVAFHTRTSGGFNPGERSAVRQTNCETVMLERYGKLRQFRPSAKGKWDVLASSTMQVSVGDQIRVTAGFREGKNVFKNNDIVELQEVTDTELVPMTGDECAGMVHGSIKAYASSLTQASAVQSIRSLCYRTALMRRAGT